jgi:hypothetical protein
MRWLDTLGDWGFCFIHTVALAWCCVKANETGNRLNGFQMARAHSDTGLKPRCE